jgi:hypothetical protein
MHAQRVLRGTLSTIAAEARGWSKGGPALLLFGEAVGLEVGAGEGNRTLIASLEGWSSTIELHPRRRRFTDHPLTTQSLLVWGDRLPSYGSRYLDKFQNCPHYLSKARMGGSHWRWRTSIRARPAFSG